MFKKRKKNCIKRREISEIYSKSLYKENRENEKTACVISNIFNEYLTKHCNVCVSSLVTYGGVDYTKICNQMPPSEIFLNQRQLRCLILFIEKIGQKDYKEAFHELMDIVIIYGADEDVSINEMVLYICLFEYTRDKKYDKDRIENE